MAIGVSPLHTLPGGSDLPTAPANTIGRPVHIVGLDGLRGLAVLSVFASHFGSMIGGTFLGWGGWLGVDTFFVLSGFLITGILYDSLHQPHFFRNFYIRRTLRIFPLYYGIWAFFLLATPWLHPLWTRFDIARVFYYGNLMVFQANSHPQIDAGAFKFFLPSGKLTGFNTQHLWSLCVEEQFYLLWPLVIFLIKDRRRIMRLCAIAIPLSLVANTWLTVWAVRNHIGGLFLYEAIYSHFAPLLFGAWIALWMRGQPSGKKVPTALCLTLIVVPLLLIFVPLYAFQPAWLTDAVNPIVTSYGFTCSALMGSGLLLAAIQPDGVFKRFFALRFLAVMGSISYGFYIVQGFLMSSFSHHLDFFVRHHVPLLLPVTAFLLAFTIAFLSYRFYELPFIRLKDKFTQTKRTAAASP